MDPIINPQLIDLYIDESIKLKIEHNQFINCRIKDKIKGNNRRWIQYQIITDKLIGSIYKSLIN